MTRRYGRTPKTRYAAMVSGIPAYVGAPSTVRCADGYHLGADGKCHKDDSESPLDPGLPIRPAKKKSANKVNPFGKRRRSKKGRRRSAKAARERTCPKGWVVSKKPGVMCELAR